MDGRDGRRGLRGARPALELGDPLPGQALLARQARDVGRPLRLPADDRRLRLGGGRAQTREPGGAQLQRAERASDPRPGRTGPEIRSRVDVVVLFTLSRPVMMSSSDAAPKRTLRTSGLSRS
jgi:hypothetical protein